MKTLQRQQPRITFNLLHSFISRTLVGAMLAYYLAYVADKPLWQQLSYIVLFVLASLLMDYLAAGRKVRQDVQLDADQLTFLGVSIDTRTITEILYSQHKRFEHRLRFCFDNNSYQDFELASADLTEDLRLYHFLLENQLPVIMLDDCERLNRAAR